MNNEDFLIACLIVAIGSVIGTIIGWGFILIVAWSIEKIMRFFERKTK